jgi:MoxR-like ATPase
MAADAHGYLGLNGLGATRGRGRRGRRLGEGHRGDTGSGQGDQRAEQLGHFASTIIETTCDYRAGPCADLTPEDPMKFQGSEKYVATQDLMLAVNAAITLQRPLLVKGEPGTGKTMLAEEVAQALDMPLLQWHIKSTTKAQQGLYEYDAVSRLRDSQLGEEKVKDIHNYIVKGVLWQAFTAEKPVALLIDEIDKADIEFPNDLLRELDRMEFYVYETRQMVRAVHRPLVFITSNNEKELPDAFLRRCFFHYIKFPDADTMRQIVQVHFPTLKQELLSAAMKTFYDVRNLPGLKKKPSTSELLDWLKLLVAEDIPLQALQTQDDKVAIPPLVGALLKNEQDVSLFEKLVFMQRHNR